MASVDNCGAIGTIFAPQFLRRCAGHAIAFCIGDAIRFVHISFGGRTNNIPISGCAIPTPFTLSVLVDRPLVAVCCNATFCHFITFVLVYICIANATLDLV